MDVIDDNIGYVVADKLLPIFYIDSWMDYTVFNKFPPVRMRTGRKLHAHACVSTWSKLIVMRRPHAWAIKPPFYYCASFNYVQAPTITSL